MCVEGSAVTQRILCPYQHISHTFYYTKQKHVNCCLDVRKLFSVFGTQFVTFSQQLANGPYNEADQFTPHVFTRVPF